MSTVDGEAASGVRCPRCREQFLTTNSAWCKCPGCGRRIVLDPSNPHMGDPDDGPPSWYEACEWFETELFRPGWRV